MVRRVRVAWLVVVAVALTGGIGCGSTGFGRPRVAPGVRTITSIGDTPESVVAGMPGASASSGPILVDRPSTRDGRIHGRIVDERGRPIAGVEVRVADGAVAAGRDLSTESDEAGGFTLRGLRPDEEYTLIARDTGARDPRLGRRRVRAPDNGVEIVVRTAEATNVARRPRAEAPRVGTEELEPPARDVVRVRANRSIEDEPALDRDLVRRAGTADPWKSMADAQAPTSHRIPFADTPDDAPSQGRSVLGLPLEDDEDLNPLPPALERPGEDGGRSFDDLPEGAEPEAAIRGGRPDFDSRSAEPEPFTSGDGPLVPSFPGPDDQSPPATREEPVPPDEFPAQREDAGRLPAFQDEPPRVPPPSAEPEGPIAPADLSDFQPITPETTDTAPSGPEAALPTPGEAALAGDAEPRTEPERRSLAPRLTWGDLTIPERRVQAPPATIYPRSVRRLPRPTPPGPEPSLAASEPGTRRDGGVTRATVRFDGRTRRLIDFTLADLDGQPVRFSEIDADFVLLDFWGTWCAPCAKTMPYLVELQENYDPSRLRVVGIAYERGPLPEQVAAVQRVAGSLGVNYPILLGERDGRPCPLLAALRVDQYPTLILLDRQGRILWRDSGSRAEMLERLNRVIAANARALAIRNQPPGRETVVR